MNSFRQAWPEPVAPIATGSDPAFQAYAVIDPSGWATEATPERQWRLEGWIPDRQTTYLTGPGSAGKSLLGQQLATCIAAGVPFMGIPTTGAPTLYLSCEDDPNELHRRQKAICEGLAVRLADLSGKLHLISDVGSIATALFDRGDGDDNSPRDKLTATSSYKFLSRIVRQLGIKLLVLDNTAHLFAGNENDRHEVAGFLSLLNRLAIEMDGAVLLLGHPNKAGDSFSGSTAWENQVRSRLYLETPADGLDRDVRVLSRQKSNYARNGETLEFRWHQWSFVRDQDLPPNMAAELANVIEASAHNEGFLRCLDKATEEKRATSPNRSASNYAPRVFAKMTSGKGMTEAGFEAAMERLLHLGQIVNGAKVYQRDNRTWATGIGRVEGCTNPCTNPAQSDAQTLHEAAQTYTTDLHALTPLDTTYLSGAATEAAAPSFRSWADAHPDDPDNMEIGA